MHVLLARALPHLSLEYVPASMPTATPDRMACGHVESSYRPHGRARLIVRKGGCRRGCVRGSGALPDGDLQIVVVIVMLLMLGVEVFFPTARKLGRDVTGANGAPDPAR